LIIFFLVAKNPGKNSEGNTRYLDGRNLRGVDVSGHIVLWGFIIIRDLTSVWITGILFGLVHTVNYPSLPDGEEGAS